MSGENQGDARAVVICAALASRVADPGESTAIAQAAINMWNETAVLLTPITGAEGVRVLFEHSLRLTKKTFPCIAFVEESGGHQPDLAGLKERLKACKPLAATTVSCALFVTFIELLATLIGDSGSKKGARSEGLAPGLEAARSEGVARSPYKPNSVTASFETSVFHPHRQK